MLKEKFLSEQILWAKDNVLGWGETMQLDGKIGLTYTVETDTRNQE